MVPSADTCDAVVRSENGKDLIHVFVGVRISNIGEQEWYSRLLGILFVHPTGTPAFVRIVLKSGARASGLAFTAIQIDNADVELGVFLKRDPISDLQVVATQQSFGFPVF